MPRPLLAIDDDERLMLMMIRHCMLVAAITPAIDAAYAIDCC